MSMDNSQYNTSTNTTTTTTTYRPEWTESQRRCHAILMESVQAVIELNLFTAPLVKSIMDSVSKKMKITSGFILPGDPPLPENLLGRDDLATLTSLSTGLLNSAMSIDRITALINGTMSTEEWALVDASRKKSLGVL